MNGLSSGVLLLITVQLSGTSDVPFSCIAKYNVVQ